MISFDLYCRLEELLIDYETNLKQAGTGQDEPKMPGLVVKAIGLIEQGDQEQELFWTLIAQCDSSAVKQLMNYFPAGAPIQELLKKRLYELETKGGSADCQESEKRKGDSRFYQYLQECVKKKGYSSVSDFYNYAGISRQRISKLRLDDSAISREFSLHMAVGLEYDYEQSVEFMKRAGYNFVPRNRRETIIAYVMRNQKYTFAQMEEALYLFQEKTFLEM